MSTGTCVLLVDIYNWYNHLDNVALSSETEDAFLCEPAAPLLGVSPRGTLAHGYQEDCSRTFIASLIIIAKQMDLGISKTLSF